MNIDSLLKYLPLLISVAGLIITWVKMGDKIESLSIRVTKLEESAEKREVILIEIRERLASIETTLKLLVK